MDLFLQLRRCAGCTDRNPSSGSVEAWSRRDRQITVRKKRGMIPSESEVWIQYLATLSSSAVGRKDTVNAREILELVRQAVTSELSR